MHSLNLSLFWSEPVKHFIYTFNQKISCCNPPVISFFFNSILNIEITMVEQFVGKWKMTSSDNFDEYMKAVGKIH